MKQYSKEFQTTLTWESTGESFKATIKVKHDGWGEVYDEDGYYCGSLNPIRTMQMAKETKNA